MDTYSGPIHLRYVGKSGGIDRRHMAQDKESHFPIRALCAIPIKSKDGHLEALFAITGGPWATSRAIQHSFHR